jgi:hypothetical protein
VELTPARLILVEETMYIPNSSLRRSSCEEVMPRKENIPL